ncbi:sensor histidine kinase [Enterovirga rhinocerotis]|uniref:histidine kinase n=1 Tax=Enterovirga rhinocerotis TaxID=1339210 RepID=A0A4R7BNJ6_9HYPH|nr:sensor histidine kinase [Enterovirga rhinocerotis]TDR85507.1 phospho-acceptor domain-containing protein [Enterovirga rhinocerotis]
MRRHLALFTVALILPILLLLGMVLWRFAMAEQNRFEREASDLASAIAVGLDRELTGIFASLEVLSTSAHLPTRDFEAFHRQASILLERQGIVAVLADLDGQQLMNVRLPWGASLPRSNIALDRTALDRGRPFVTDLIVGQITGTRQILAVTGVRIDGKLTYLLFFSVPLDQLRQVLTDAGIAGAYTASLIDRRGLILARSRDADALVGQTAKEDMRENARDAQGTWDGTAADGRSIFGAYARSRLSDFVAAVEVGYADLRAPLWRSLSVFALLGAAIAALSTWLAMYVGRQITRPIAALARTAAALGRGEPVTPLATGLAEANEVGRVLVGASSNLRDREADLVEANQEIQRFAYIVSHDLRSPLVNIMGFTTELEALRGDLFTRLDELKEAAGVAENAARDEELGQDFDEAIGFIKASISKMDRLINAILRLSREGRRDFTPERIDMDALGDGIKRSLAIQADEADATVTINRLPSIVSDRVAIEQVFSNLIDNALKYLRNGVPGRIEIVGKARGATLVFEVRDNGRGIDARDADRVFDLFRRSGVQDRPGEGIGLAHVRALVRRLGGTITLTSTPGQGSTFTVTLPRRWTQTEYKRVA